MNHVLLFLLVLVVHGTMLCAGVPQQRPADGAFIENKGQIGDQDGKPNPDVRFLIVRPGLNIQLRTNGFSYDSYVVDRCELPPDDQEPMLPPSRRDRPNEELTYRFHRVDIELVDANPVPVITSREQSADYLNYYTHITELANGEQGATSVRGFGRITYHDVWPGIDLEWFIDDEGNPEYQFMVRPGGDPDRIRLRYHGANATELLSDAIMIQVEHGPIQERIPKSFYAASGQPVDVRYRKVGHNTFGVVVPSVAMAMAVTETLVIDPTPQRLWGTYYGGTSAVSGARSVAVTPAGDIVIAGGTTSTTTIATAGSHQQAYGGGTNDSFVAVFTAAGIRRWGTYYGGASSDNVYAVAVTSSGDIVHTGYTSSTTGIVTAGAHQQTYGGGMWDAYVAVLTDAGVRRWGTYYGGTNDDLGLSIAVTSAGDIVLGGRSGSTNGIAMAGAFQQTRSSTLDAFLAVFTSAGVRRWGTYYGGTNDDHGFGVAVAPSGDIVLAGFTSSTTGIATAGSHQQVFGGGADAFLAVFTDAGARRWGTYFGGVGGDQGYAVAVTSAGNIVLCGNTISADGIASTGAHQETLGGGGDPFVAVFTDAGVRRWSTYYGDSWAGSGNAVTVTPAGEIVLAGDIQSRSGVATTGSHQEIYGGGGVDAYLVVFTDAGVRRWGTYYGGTDSDYGYDVASMPIGDLVLVGSTPSKTGIATVGAHQQTHGGGTNENAFVVVFGTPCTPPSVALTSSVAANKICLEQVTTLKASADSGTRLRWTQPKRGTITNAVTDTTVSIRWTSVGVDTVRVRVMRTADSTCFRDTMIVVTVNALPTPVIKSPTGFAMCAGDSLTLDAGAGYVSYAWFEGTTPAGTGRYLVTKKAATYTVRVSNDTCFGTSPAVSTIVNRLPTPVITSTTGFAMCTGDSVTLDGGAGYVSYAWFEGTTPVDTGRYLVTRKAGRYTVRVSNDTCFGTSPAVMTIVNRRPAPVITSSKGFTLCEGDSLTLDAGGGYVSYAWFEGDTQVGTGRSLVTGKAATYTVRVSNDTCFGTSAGVEVTVNPLPDAAVSGPTAICLSDAAGKTYAVPQGAPGTRFKWTITPPTRGSIVAGRTGANATVTWQQRGSATLTVSVTGPEGCSRDSSVTVTIADSLSPTIRSTTGFSMCTGDSVILDAGAGYTTYAWFEGTTSVGTGRYLVTKKASTYAVRVSNAGCSGTSAKVTTTVNALPTATVTENPAGTLVASTDATSASYQWYDASADPWRAIAGSTQTTYAPTASGRYGVEVTSKATGCRSRSTAIDITLGPPPADPVVTALTPAATVCRGDNATLRVRVVGGRAPYGYQWTDGATALPSTDASVTWTPATSASVTCIVTDADGKRDTATMTVTVTARPVAAITEAPAGTLTAQPAGADSYQWLDASRVPLAGATSASYQPRTSGRYYVVVTQQGCGDTSDAATYTAPPIGRLEVADYDYGTVPVDGLINASGGHLGSVRVQNRTGSYLEITGATTGDPSTFVVPQQWPLRLNDGDTAEIAVRFKPTEKRAYSTAITVATSTSATASATITGTGRDLEPDDRVIQVVLQPSRAEVDAGDTVSVQLVITEERPKESAGQAGRYSAAIRWDYRVLDLLPTPGVSYDTTGAYAVAGLPSALRQQDNMRLYSFQFRAKEGDTDTTNVSFHGAAGFAWQDYRKAYVVMVDTKIRVRHCRDGGCSVPPGIVALLPNPAQDEVDVQWKCDGPSVLSVVTLAGEVVVQETLPATDGIGQRTLAIRQLAVGSYRVVLRYANGFATQQLIVLP